MKHYTLCKKSLAIALAIVTTLAFISCRKDSPRLFKDHDRQFGMALVYVAGYEFNGTNNVAKSWIDDQEITLSDGTNDAAANSIFVAGNDAYIAGNDGGPVYWKNATEIPLPFNSNISASASSIYVKGDIVYVAGRDGNSAVYWRDGTEIILNTTNTYGNYAGARANSIFISGNDIYVAGTHGPNAVYWKNGQEVYLTTLNSDLLNVAYEATSIDVKGGKVYVVGTEDIVGSFSPFGKYWKDGIDESLTLNHPDFDVVSFFLKNSVFVSGNDVYISAVGFNTDPSFHYTAAYWINGDETILPSSATQSYTSDIYVRGNDVYVSGSETNGNTNKTYAQYWKNGTVVKLTDGTRNANATSIFIN